MDYKDKLKLFKEKKDIFDWIVIFFIFSACVLLALITVIILSTAIYESINILK